MIGYQYIIQGLHNHCCFSSVQFMVSGPMYLIYEYLADDLSHKLNRTNVKRISAVWRPDRHTQTGTQQICAWAVDECG